MKYRITVLMGIYNCADTLEEALDSIMAQTYKNFKIILCDDNSNDNTYEIAKQYSKKYENIILIKNSKNIKLAATLNKCLEFADTEFIARMDGDDISLPHRFQKQIDFLDSNPQYAFVSCPMIHFDDNGVWKYGKAKEKPQINDFKYNTPFCHAPVMIRTQAMNSVNGYTAEKWTIRIEDYYLWYKLYKKGYIGYNLQEHLYMMRDDKNAISRRKISDRWNTYKVGVIVKKSLGVSNPYFSGLLGLSKILVPTFFIRFIRFIRK